MSSLLDLLNSWILNEKSLLPSAHLIFSKQNRLVSANWCHAWKILVKAFWLTSSAQLEITNELRKWHCLPCRPSHWDKGSRLSSCCHIDSFYWKAKATGRMPSSSKRGTLPHSLPQARFDVLLVLLKASGSHMMVMIFGDKRVIVSYITIHFITILLHNDLTIEKTVLIFFV